MIRYRVVSPSNGSGDIRKTLFTLLSKITKNDIPKTVRRFLLNNLYFAFFLLLFKAKKLLGDT